MLLIFMSITLVTYWITVQNRKHHELNTKLKNIPGTNSTYPILGDIHMWSITKWSIHDKLNNFIETMQDYPTTLKVWFGSKVVIVINNPEDVRTILTSPDCIDKSSIYRLTIGGEGLLTASGNKWRNQRRHLNTTFSPRVLSSYSKDLNQFGRNIVSAVKEHAVIKKEFDVTPSIGVLVTDLIMRTIYGSTNHKLDLSNQCYALVERLMLFWGQQMLQIYFHIILVLYRKILRIPSEDKQLNKALRFSLQPILNQRVVEYQNKLKSHESEVKDEFFLEKLTRLRFEGAIGINEYRHTSMTIFLAATETTARSLSIIILLLAMHQEYQQNIYEEICNFFDVHDDNDDIDISKLSQLNYVNRFIKEAFRIFPVIPFFGRQPTRDIAIKEGIIPAGTDILISVVNMHHHPDVWGKDAKTFNPDNFLPEAEANRSSCSYLPFSYGPRNCIGFKFAEFAMFIGTVYLLKNYHLKTTLKMEDIRFGYGSTTYLLSDNLVSIEQRNIHNNNNK